MATVVHAIRAEDIAAAHRAADKLREFYARQGRDINVSVDKYGQIISDLSAARAITNPPTATGVPGLRIPTRTRVLEFLRAHPDRWFIIPEIVGPVKSPRESVEVALYTLRREGFVRSRHMPVRRLGAPRIQYALQQEGKSDE